MVTILKVIRESIAQALQQLAGNKLRTFLSLLGITIGIFCIIGVQSGVDSLETSIKSSFEQLGRDVVYISKFPWAGGSETEFRKWLRRPNTSYQDYKAINKKVKSMDNSTFYVFMGLKTIQYQSNSIDDVESIGITFEYADMFDLKFERGRYFSSREYFYGDNKIVLGNTVASELFGDLNPLGRKVKLFGRKLEVIGVLEKSGEDLIGISDFDERILVSFELARKLTNLRTNANFQNSFLAVKAAEGVSIDRLKDEVTGVMRAQRRLKPRQEDNFSVNELSMMTSVFEVIFGSLSNMGLVVGIFAIIVGVFSVANIMFVSVKERTNLIGIKKALGAKRYIILLEFLIESIILCILGGLIGLILIQLGVVILTEVTGFQLYLSLNNIINGLLWSICIGILAGVIPAFQASLMNPVDAIRSK
ncbi:MAG: ABC transporter permease [Bacteroidota bacterium]